MIVSRAPLRIGIAGGGTDVDPFCSTYGGDILNATIDLYAWCLIEPVEDRVVKVKLPNLKKFSVWQLDEIVNSDLTKLPLPLIIYKSLRRRIGIEPLLGHTVSVFCDCAPGTGLGSSSAVVVAIINAYLDLFKVTISKNELARLAFLIEREDAGFTGGRQDQYASVYGGFNRFIFHTDNKVTRIPIQIKSNSLLSQYALLYFTGESRDSSEIINEQARNIKINKAISLDATRKIKQAVSHMRDAISNDNIEEISALIQKNWIEKKKFTERISNKHIDEIISSAFQSGAISAKVSGAGGGGCILFLVPPINRDKVISKLGSYSGFFLPFNFTFEGAMVLKTQ